MCNAAAVAIGAQVAGGLLQNQANQAQAASDEQTALANARLARGRAEDARVRGAQEEGLVRMEGSRAVGAVRTAFAAGDISTQSGSPLDAMADTRMVSEIDALTRSNNAAREAWGYDVQAIGYEDTARNIRRNASRGGLATFLGTAAGVAGTISSSRRS